MSRLNRIYTARLLVFEISLRFTCSLTEILQMQILLFAISVLVCFIFLFYVPMANDVTLCWCCCAQMANDGFPVQFYCKPNNYIESDNFIVARLSTFTSQLLMTGMTISVRTHYQRAHDVKMASY